MPILTLNICNDYPKQSSKYRSMEQEKKQILMKDNEQTTLHSFSMGTILKGQ